MGRIIEGVWNCSSCGTKGIGASKKTCPNCGGVQESYSLPNQIKYVDKVTADKVRNTGPDWYCSYCERLNSSYEKTCSGCGSSKEQSEKNYFDRKREIARKQAKEKESTWENNTNKDDTYYTSSTYKNTSNTYNDVSSMVSVDLPSSNTMYRSTKNINFSWISNIVHLLPFVGIVALIVLLFVGIFIKIPHEETITSFSWERVVEVEDYKTVREDGWSIPSGGRLLYQQEEIRSYDTVIDHYETKTVEKSRQVIDHYEEVFTGNYRDLGNGYYEEITTQEPVYKTEYYTETVQEPVYKQVPIYDTRYYYEIDKWVHNRNETTSGTDKSPYWADPALLASQRANNSSEKYMVYTINEEEETNSYQFSESEWMKYEEGDVIVFTTNFFGIVNSDSIQLLE